MQDSPEPMCCVLELEDTLSTSKYLVQQAEKLLTGM